MANFKFAITETLASEGFIAKYGKLGYVNDPDDNGGETIAGIARRFWPKYSIWTVVDSYKKLPNFPHNMSESNILPTLVELFYKTYFWDKIKGDAMSNQDIAALLVDKCVLEGIVPAIKRAQSIVHLPETGVVTDELINLLNSL
jgi:lysozyme family protein